MVLGPGEIVPAALRLYQLSGGAGFAEEAQHFRCWFHIQHVYTTAERARHGLQVGRPGLVTHRAVNKRGAGIADMQFVQRSIEAALIIKQLLHWTTVGAIGPANHVQHCSTVTHAARNHVFGSGTLPE